MGDSGQTESSGAVPEDGPPAGTAPTVAPASAPIEETDERVARLYERVRGDDGALAAQTGGPPPVTSGVSPLPPVSLPPAPEFVLPPPPRPLSAPSWERPPRPPAATGRRRLSIRAAVVALVVLAAAVFVVADRGHASGTEGAAALTAAVRTTEQAKTADVALSVTINGAGAGITIAGDGATSFTSAASSLDLTYASAATGERPVTERAVIDGSTGYYDLGPSVGALDPGKSWVSVDLGSASGSAAPGGAGSGSTGSGPGAGAGAGAGGLGGGGIFDDPWSLLAVLGTPGTTANALGSADVDGVAVRRYALALGPAGIARALASQQLPSSVRADLSSTRFQALDYRVSVDGAQHLRQVSTAGSYTVAGEHFSVVSTMDLSAYGTPVRVSPPPASEVVTAQELERLAVQQQGKSIV